MNEARKKQIIAEANREFNNTEIVEPFMDVKDIFDSIGHENYLRLLDYMAITREFYAKNLYNKAHAEGAKETENKMGIVGLCGHIRISTPKGLICPTCIRHEAQKDMLEKVKEVVIAQDHTVLGKWILKQLEKLAEEIEKG